MKSWKYTVSKNGRHQKSEVKGGNVCMVWNCRGKENNAHLIAAAPEMYKMIKVMLEQFGNEEDCINEYDYIVIREAKKLLAKARGEL